MGINEHDLIVIIHQSICLFFCFTYDIISLMQSHFIENVEVLFLNEDQDEENINFNCFSWNGFKF